MIKNLAVAFILFAIYVIFIEKHYYPMDDAGVSYIQGEIELTFPQTVLNPRSRAVYITSPGGNLKAALTLSEQVYAMGIPVVVMDRCYSACTLIFAASPHKIAGEYSVFGFHSPRYVGNGSVHADEWVEQGRKTMREYYMKYGLGENFIDSFIDVKDMKFFTGEELQKIWRKF